MCRFGLQKGVAACWTEKPVVDKVGIKTMHFAGVLAILSTRYTVQSECFGLFCIPIAKYKKTSKVIALSKKISKKKQKK